MLRQTSPAAKKADGHNGSKTETGNTLHAMEQGLMELSGCTLGSSFITILEGAKFLYCFPTKCGGINQGGTPSLPQDPKHEVDTDTRLIPTREVRKTL